MNVTKTQRGRKGGHLGNFPIEIPTSKSKLSRCLTYHILRYFAIIDNFQTTSRSIMSGILKNSTTGPWWFHSENTKRNNPNHKMIGLLANSLPWMQVQVLPSPAYQKSQWPTACRKKGNFLVKIRNSKRGNPILTRNQVQIEYSNYQWNSFNTLPNTGHWIQWSLKERNET